MWEINWKKNQYKKNFFGAVRGNNEVKKSKLPKGTSIVRTKSAHQIQLPSSIWWGNWRGAAFFEGQKVENSPYLPLDMLYNFVLYTDWLKKD